MARSDVYMHMHCCANDRERATVELVVCQEFTVAQAADMLGVTPKTIRSRLRRFRQKVRKCVAHPCSPGADSRWYGAKNTILPDYPLTRKRF